MVRGPSNSQVGRNGMMNMAARAASPIQGVEACDIRFSFSGGMPALARR